MQRRRRGRDWGRLGRDHDVSERVLLDEMLDERRLASLGQAEDRDEHCHGVSSGPRRAGSD